MVSIRKHCSLEDIFYFSTTENEYRKIRDIEKFHMKFRCFGVGWALPVFRKTQLINQINEVSPSKATAWPRDSLPAGVWAWLAQAQKTVFDAPVLSSFRTGGTAL